MPIDERTLRDLIREAGFDTLSAFGEAAGLSRDVVSRLCSPAPDRRPTLRQTGAVARALGMPLHEVASFLFPVRSPELELLTAAFLEGREQARAELEPVRDDLEETSEKLTAARKEIDLLRIQLVESESKAGALAATRADDDGAEPRQLPQATTRATGLSKGRGVAARRAARGEHVLASEETTEARLAVCRSGRCGQYLAGRDHCIECGCYVSAKAKLLTERCPLGLWTDQPKVLEATAADLASATPDAGFDTLPPAMPGPRAVVRPPETAPPGAPPASACCPEVEQARRELEFLEEARRSSLAEGAPAHPPDHPNRRS